jgi:hypothetical protein
MDLEQLIEESINEKANSVAVELPSFEDIWGNASRHKRYLPRKRFNFENFSIAGWLEIAVILVMLFILPAVITSVRNSPTTEIKPGSNQQTILTNADIEKAEEEASRFLTQLNTFSDVKNYMEKDYLLYPNDNRTNQLKPYLSSTYSSDFIAGREPLIIPNAAVKLQSGVNTDSVTLIKYSEDPQKKQIVFTFYTEARFDIVVGTKPFIVKITGQITMKNENNTWKVNLYYPRSSEPSDWYNKIMNDWLFQ